MGGLPHFDPPGQVGFAQPFWEAIAQRELRLPKCSVCDRWQWYPDDAGTCCDGGVLVWEPVSGSGTVHTFTTVRRPFLPDGAEDVPFTVVFVELDDAPGLRFVGNTTDDGVTFGSRVALSFEEFADRLHPVFHLDSAA